MKNIRQIKFGNLSISICVFTKITFFFSCCRFPIVLFNFIIVLFTEEDCYHCMASLVASKEKMFITQTKLLYEVTWKTIMQICKKHVVSVLFLPFFCQQIKKCYQSSDDGVRFQRQLRRDFKFAEPRFI